VEFYNLNDPSYGDQKKIMTKKVLNTVELVLHNFRNSIKLLLNGSPITFKRFTDREPG